MINDRVRMPRVFARTAAVISLAAAVAFGACEDDDDLTTPPGAAEFTVRIENVTEASAFLKSDVFDTPSDATEPAPIVPGEAYEFSFTAGPDARLSFATMFVPSNDFFYAPPAEGIELYDAAGNPIEGDITSQIQLWDAGTEINQEPGLGADQVQRQSGPDTGADDPDSNVRVAEDEFDNLPDVSDVINVTVTPSGDNEFTVRVENVSDQTTLATSDGNTQAVPLSPGVWVVHEEENALFTPGSALADDGLEAIAEDGMPETLGANLDENSGVTHYISPGVWVVHENGEPVFTEGEDVRGLGLEGIAEDGSPTALADAITDVDEVIESAIFNTTENGTVPGPAGPGEAYEFTFSASEGERLSFATMFVQSNDLFLAPEGDGIALFDATGDPVSGDVTGQIILWDAGTEVNQEPGIGADQAMRQDGPDTGQSENEPVRPISEVSDGYTYPAVTRVIRVTITANDGS